MSDTPRTDAEEAKDNGDTQPIWEFARTLERELNEANAELAKLRQAIDVCRRFEAMHRETTNMALEELAKARKDGKESP